MVGFRVPIPLLVSVLITNILAASWEELLLDKNANYYQIVSAYESEQALNPSKKSNKEKLFEDLEKDDYAFMRWKNQVEVRVMPSGDLSLLNKTAEEIRPWLGIDGKPLPKNYGTWVYLGPKVKPTGSSFLGIPSGMGRINFVRLDPKNTKKLYVGSPGGGLWVTENEGVSWKPLTDQIALLGVADIAIDPINTNSLYITTGDRDGRTIRGANTPGIGVLKSTDGGATWSTTGLVWDPTKGIQGKAILIDPNSPNVIIQASSDGIHRSEDGGKTFVRSAGITGSIRALKFKSGDPNTVYASETNVYRSTDNGKTWNLVRGVSGARVELAVSNAAPNNVWAYTENGTVYRSTNSGQSFTSLGTGATGDRSEYNLAIGVSHVDAKIMITGVNEASRSTDGGQSWSAFQANAHWDHHGIEFVPGTGTAYTATDGGLYRSVNGAAWTPLIDGLHVSEMYRIGVSKSNPNNFCNGYQDNGSTVTMGNNTTRIDGADGMECFYDWSNGSTFFIEIYNAAMSRCAWNGSSASCQSIASPPNGIWETPWGQDPVNASMLYSGGGGNMYRSPNKGGSWSQLGSLGGSGDVRNFGVAPANTQIIYVAKGNSVLKTINGGSSWIDITSGISGTPTYIAVHPKDPNKIWVSISGFVDGRKVYKSVDGGTNWTTYATGLPNIPANTIVSEGDAKGGVYIGMDVGVFYRNDQLPSWVPYFNGMPNVMVKELEIAGTGDSAAVYAATYGRGAWKSPVWGNTIAVVGKTPGIVLTDMKYVWDKHTRILEIQFHVNAKGGGKLTLMDSRGKIHFSDKASDRTFYRKTIDLKKGASGIFLLHFQSDGQSIVRRIVLN